MELSSAGALIGSSSVLNQGLVQPGALTPDALMAYLQTRLGGLDEQIDGAFKKQQQVQAMRKELAALNRVAGNLSTEEETTLKPGQMTDIEEALKGLDQLDSGMAKALRQDLANAKVTRTISDGSTSASGDALGPNDHNLTPDHPETSGEPLNGIGESEANKSGQPQALAQTVHVVANSSISADGARQFQEAIDSRMKLLESSAQMEMIQLQSVMSARQTAVQMCTNLISKLAQTNQAVAQNI